MATILLAQEDPETGDNFASLLSDFFPVLKLQRLSTLDEVITGLQTAPAGSLLLTDTFWAEENCADEILLLAEKFPAAQIGILSRYDLTTTLHPAFPLPLLRADNQLPLRIAEFMEDFSERTFGPYHLVGPAGPHPLGRLYWAEHHQLKRSVQVLVPPAGSPTFAKAIRSYARLHHASTFSLYESIPWEGRTLVALEPILHPSLLHLRFSEERPSLVACARIASALGSVLQEMENSSIPARLLSAYDYTLSPRGTPRLRNPAATPSVPSASVWENANRLATILRPLLPDEPASPSLLHLLENPGSSAFDLRRQANELERRLADVREVQVRTSEIESAEQAIRARIRRRWALVGGAVAAVLFVALSIWVVYDRFVLDAPGKLNGGEILVPKGNVTLQNKNFPVPEFWLDRHEVTLGEYEKFLLQLSSMQETEWRKLLPKNTSPPANLTPKNFIPADWDDILARARKGEKYRGWKITRDTPVFGVDFPYAYAYAKWKGRRLPTDKEWLRAASGDKSLPFPWGLIETNPAINLGSNFPADLVTKSDYFHLLQAESNPRDQAPFGHFDLGGNLSEWVGPPAHLLGGNYKDLAPVANDGRTRGIEDLEQDGTRVGFRTARDKEK